MRVLIVLVLAALPWADAFSQSYPTRPIRLVVGLQPGSGADIVSRILAEKMRDVLGQPVVVENRPGADGIIAARHVAAAAPDGYTLLQATSGMMSIIPVIQATPPYDPVRDFEPVSMIARWPLALVVASEVPARSVAELVAYAKAHPDKLNYGAASSNYMLATEMFTKLTGIEMHHIPYPSNATVVQALLAGDVQVAIVTAFSSLPQINAGKLKALAVNSAAREPNLPDVPTMAEAGVPGFNYVMWVAMFAPASTPPEIIGRLQAAIATSLQSEDVRTKLAATGMAAMSGSPQFLRETIDHDTKIYGGMAKALRAAGK